MQVDSHPVPVPHTSHQEDAYTQDADAEAEDNVLVQAQQKVVVQNYKVEPPWSHTVQLPQMR